MSALLTITGLSVEYYRQGTAIHAVRGVSLAVEAGETLAIVGESGSGKSTLALAIMGIIFPHEGRRTAGSIRLGTDELTTLPPESLRQMRGSRISMVFQDPFSSLNPVLSIGTQLQETLRAHHPALRKQEIDDRMIAALRDVQFPDPERIIASYPHQLSGGQRQRVVLAMALLNKPQLLIADEPTTALDVTIQKEVLDLLDTLKQEYNLTTLFITHNVPLAAQRSTRTAVMYAGEIVELGPSAALFARPQHPYTRGLVASVPRLHAAFAPNALAGNPPDLATLTPGCPFYARCPEADPACATVRPPVHSTGSSMVRCTRHTPEGGRL